jgi:ferredoxin
MCRFCTEHGDGKAWYLEAASYAADLDADLDRREYLVEFVADFGEQRARILANLARLERLPARLRGLASARASKLMEPVHFGQPVPIEEVEAILDITTSIVRVPCVCRYHAGRRSDGYCLMVTTKPYDAMLDEAFADYDTGPDTSRFQRLSKTEAVSLLRRVEDEGLMHSVWTFLTPFIAAICNCDLESGCMAMTLTVEHGVPNMLHGHRRAEADPSACTGCAVCVKRCPFRAVTLDPAGRKARVDPEACYGCGICRSGCAPGALALVERGSPT